MDLVNRPRNFAIALFAVLVLLTTLPGGALRGSNKHHTRKRARHAPASHSPRRGRSAARERASKEETLRKIQQEIAKYESELREHERREKRSKANISTYNKQTAALKAKIHKLQDELREFQTEKSDVDRSLTETSSTLESLKAAYAKSSRALYISGSMESSDTGSLFFDGESSDPVRMRYYAGAIARAHAMNRAKLDSMKLALGESSNELAQTIESEHEEIGTHQEEASTLESKKAAEAKQLAQIQARKEQLRALLAERKASAKRLESIIAGLVRREANARTTKKGHRKTTEYETERSLGPVRGPHSLEWPSASHRIVQGFGEHRNAELGTVTMNLGVDIAAPAGSVVRAAAEGEVALVSTLPSYGTIVVIRHAGSLHTVYADLTSASVREGAHVRAGEAIGRSGTNPELGAAMHFEVWKGKSKQNPSAWLK